MSKKHPIITVTGSSGTGRDDVRKTFDTILDKEGLTAAYIQGDGFHLYTREQMRQAVAEAVAEGRRQPSHFGPDTNDFPAQEILYKEYGAHGSGKRRFYIHNTDDLETFSDFGVELEVGGFTPWEDIPLGTDMMIYEGLHGCVKTDTLDLGQYVDLRVGVTPIINLEWIQKIHRDTKSRGYSEEAVMDTILRRMPDYIRYVIPQFHHSDINIQRVPVVDTSDPIIARDIPKDSECMLVVRFRRPEDYSVDFATLLRRLQGSWMARRNTIVVPAGHFTLALQLIFTPILRQLMERRKQA